MDRRRGSPPPPPREPRGGGGSRGGGHFGGRDPRAGDPFRDPRDMERRRGRSPSPNYDRYPRGGNRGGSPPPAYKRHRRDEPHYDRYGRDPSPPYRGGRGGSPGGGGYDREQLPDDRRGGPRGRPADDKPRLLTFKEFLLDQPDDPSPEDAQARYRSYLVDFHGGEIKAEFAEKKNDENVRAMFDPRMFEKMLVKRNEEARESAQQFVKDFESGVLDPEAPGFNQGMLELAPPPEPAPVAGADAAAGDGADAGEGKPPGDAKKEGAEGDNNKVVYAPAVCWSASRVAVDLALARRLARKLDLEKGITVNPLAPSKHQPAAAAAAAADGPGAGDDDKKEEKAEDGSGLAGQPSGNMDTSEAGEGGPKEASQPQAPTQPEEEEEAIMVDEGNLVEVTGKLDQLLSYLWRVHGIDYYAGYELTVQEYVQRLTACRMLRVAKPEEGEGSAETDAHDLELVAKTVDESWERRLQEGDPLVARCQRKRVEEAVDKWVEDQIVQHAEQKWGNKLSNKLFLGRKFVVKHIRVKHAEKVQAQREVIYDELFFENFKHFKEEEARAAEQAQTGGGGEGFEGQGFEGEAGAGQGSNFRGGRGGRFGGRFGGPGRFGGRFGGRMGMMGRGMMGMMDMPVPVMPMGGPMGPMFMPAHGAGPMGPFLPIIPAAPMMGPIIAMGGRGGMRGGRFGGPMRGRGGRFGGGGGMMMMGGPKMDPSGVREYYDLDNPQNNRAVLDYGDL